MAMSRVIPVEAIAVAQVVVMASSMRVNNVMMAMITTRMRAQVPVEALGAVMVCFRLVLKNATTEIRFLQMVVPRPAKTRAAVMGFFVRV